MATNKEFSISRILPARAESNGLRTKSLVGDSADNLEPTINEIDMAQVEVYYNGLDRVISEMHERFNGSTSSVLLALSDIIVNKIPKPNNFDVIANVYKLDLEELKLEKSLYQNVDISTSIGGSTNATTPCRIAYQMQASGLHESLPQFGK